MDAVVDASNQLSYVFADPWIAVPRGMGARDDDGRCGEFSYSAFDLDSHFVAVEDGEHKGDVPPTVAEVVQNDDFVAVIFVKPLVLSVLNEIVLAVPGEALIRCQKDSAVAGCVGFAGSCVAPKPDDIWLVVAWLDSDFHDGVHVLDLPCVGEFFEETLARFSCLDTSKDFWVGELGFLIRLTLTSARVDHSTKLLKVSILLAICHGLFHIASAPLKVKACKRWHLLQRRHALLHDQLKEALKVRGPVLATFLSEDCVLVLAVVGEEGL